LLSLQPCVFHLIFYATKLLNFPQTTKHFLNFFHTFFDVFFCLILSFPCHSFQSPIPADFCAILAEYFSKSAEYFPKLAEYLRGLGGEGKKVGK